MTRAQIYALVMLLFSLRKIRVLAVDDQGPPLSHVQPGPLLCWTAGIPNEANAFIQDCHIALQHIPSGHLTFEGGNPPTWSIESPALRKKFLPALFEYQTCSIEVLGNPYIHTPLPQSLGSVARTMYYHVWPAVREGVERVMEQCTEEGKITGTEVQTLMFDGHGPYKLIVHIGGYNSNPIPPSRYHVYDATSRGADEKKHS